MRRQTKLGGALVVAAMVGALGCGSRSGLLDTNTGGANGASGAASGGTSGGGAGGASGGTGGALGLCPPGSGVVTLASNLASPWDIAIDDTYVYASLGVDPGGIVRVPKTGGAVTTLVDGPSRVHHLALTDDGVLFSASVAGRVLLVAKDGNALTNLAEFQHFPEGVATMGSTRFWVYQSAGVHGALIRFGLDDSKPEPLVTDLHDPWDLVAKGDWLYFQTHNDAKQPRGIHRYHTKSALLETVVDTTLEANDFEVTDDAIFFTTNAGLSRYALGAQGPVELTQGHFYGLSLLNGDVFVAQTGFDGAIRRYDPLTNTSSVIADGQSWPRHVVADSRCVYWTEQGTAGELNGSLKRAPR
ncbi:MAG: hypothetical protein R3B13_08440 [Polyangiaceae bacterium]